MPKKLADRLRDMQNTTEALRARVAVLEMRVDRLAPRARAQPLRVDLSPDAPDLQTQPGPTPDSRQEQAHSPETDRPVTGVL